MRRDHLAARRNERVVLEGRVDRRSNPCRIVMHRVIPWLASRLEFIDFRFVAIASFSSAHSLSLSLLTIYLFIFYLSSAEFPLVISKLECAKVARNFSLAFGQRSSEGTFELFRLKARGLEKHRDGDVN